jgi:NDP-sugar pyrophosphorylase family protein
MATFPIKKAVLLAAGFGTRIRPLSYDTPKPMMPLWGKPLIGHAIDLVQSWGVSEILVNTHHAPESLLHYCRERSSASCHIQVSFEPSILGTGGALKRADWFIKDGPFWMLNTDIAADVDPAPLVRAFRRHKALAALWMHPSRGPRTVAMRGTHIQDFASPTPGTDGTYTFCGLQLLSPRILDYLPEAEFCSVVDGYRNAKRKRQQVLGISLPDTFWADLGSPERYLAAHRDVLLARKRREPGKRLLLPKQLKSMQARVPEHISTKGFVAVGDHVVFPDANAKVRQASCPSYLEDSVLWNGAVVRSGTHLTNSIIGRDTVVRGTIGSSTAVRTDPLPNDVILSAALSALSHRRPREGGSPQPSLHSPLATLISLPARGSDRTFERIQTPHTSAILVRYDDSARRENARYASHTRLLKRHGIGVPGVLLDLPELKATLFEDGGDRALDSEFATLSPRRRQTLYRRVLDQLVLLHRLPRRTLTRLELEPPFSPKLYAWERDLFAEHFLDAYLRLPADTIQRIKRELAGLADTLDRVPQVLVHRDMQSSNVLLKGRDLTLIDFQGMRMGPAAYDVASLLCDPYVMLDANLQDGLLAYYLAQAPHADSTRATFHTAAVQRLGQALGAYGRLSALPGASRFARHIPPACQMMQRMLNYIEGMPTLRATLDQQPPPSNR